MGRLYSKRKTVSDVRQVQLQWMQVLHAKEQHQEGLLAPSLKCTISACADACTLYCSGQSVMGTPLDVLK